MQAVKVGNVTDTDEWARRGSSFGAVAGTYAELRPDYPLDAVRWCVAPVGRDIGTLRVLDLGAGTGKLTAMLAGLGTDVTAVEPDPAMLGELPIVKGMLAQHPNMLHSKGPHGIPLLAHAKAGGDHALEVHEYLESLMKDG